MTTQRSASIVYVALLRGINVGGNRTVSMAALKQTFERLGLEGVRTYINSGNVVFRATEDRRRLATRIEQAIEQDLGLRCDVLLRSLEEVEALLAGLPRTWVNDSSMRCDVMFLWDDVDDAGVLGSLSYDPAMEEVRYLPGAVVWRVDRDHVTRSRMSKMIGTPLYRRLTARNANTVRKLGELMREAASVSSAPARAPAGRAAPRRRASAAR